MAIYQQGESNSLAHKAGSMELPLSNLFCMNTALKTMLQLHNFMNRGALVVFCDSCSSIFVLQTSPRLDDNNNNNINNSSSNHSRKSTQKHRPKKPQQKPRLQQSPKASIAWRQTHATRPLLGYDWIAGVLDNQDKSVINASDKFFKRISEFRWQHKEDCTTDEPSVRYVINLLYTHLANVKWTVILCWNIRVIITFQL